jgi:hypothetical protein
VLKWLMRRPPTTHRSAEPDPAGTAAVRSEPSTPLHKYLADRYADTVVLTFTEIEDLMGFSLPAGARLSTDWWTTPDSGVSRSRIADAWIRTHRTARPNLQAQTITFERIVA